AAFARSPGTRTFSSSSAPCRSACPAAATRTGPCRRTRKRSPQRGAPGSRPASKPSARHARCSRATSPCRNAGAATRSSGTRSSASLPAPRPRRSGISSSAPPRVPTGWTRCLAPALADDDSHTAPLASAPYRGRSPGRVMNCAGRRIPSSRAAKRRGDPEPQGTVLATPGSLRLWLAMTVRVARVPSVRQVSAGGSRHVIVRRAGRDRRMSLQRLLELEDHAPDRPAHPALERVYVGLFLRILDQVEEVRRLEVVGALVRLRLPDEVHLPVAPLRRAQLGLDVVDEAFAGRLLLPAEHQVELVDA